MTAACPQCHHDAHRGRCSVDACPCKLSRPSLAPKPPRAEPVRLPADAREAWIAHHSACIYDALMTGGQLQFCNLLRAAWDDGFLESQRQPRAGVSRCRDLAHGRS